MKAGSLRVRSAARAGTVGSERGTLQRIDRIVAPGRRQRLAGMPSRDRLLADDPQWIAVNLGHGHGRQRLRTRVPGRRQHDHDARQRHAPCLTQARAAPNPATCPCRSETGSASTCPADHGDSPFWKRTAVGLRMPCPRSARRASRHARRHCPKRRLRRDVKKDAPGGRLGRGLCVAQTGGVSQRIEASAQLDGAVPRSRRATVCCQHLQNLVLN